MLNNASDNEYERDRNARWREVVLAHDCLLGSYKTEVGFLDLDEPMRRLGRALARIGITRHHILQAEENGTLNWIASTGLYNALSPSRDFPVWSEWSPESLVPVLQSIDAFVKTI